MPRMHCQCSLSPSYLLTHHFTHGNTAHITDYNFLCLQMYIFSCPIHTFIYSLILCIGISIFLCLMHRHLHIPYVGMFTYQVLCIGISCSHDWNINVHTLTTASFVDIMYTGNQLFVDPLQHLSAVENLFYTFTTFHSAQQTSINSTVETQDDYFLHKLILLISR